MPEWKKKKNAWNDWNARIKYVRMCWIVEGMLEGMPEHRNDWMTLPIIAR